MDVEDSKETAASTADTSSSVTIQLVSLRTELNILYILNQSSCIVCRSSFSIAFTVRKREREIPLYRGRISSSPQYLFCWSSI